MINHRVQTPSPIRLLSQQIEIFNRSVATETLIKSFLMMGGRKQLNQSYSLNKFYSSTLSNDALNEIIVLQGKIENILEEFTLPGQLLNYASHVPSINENVIHELQERSLTTASNLILIDEFKNINESLIHLSTSISEEIEQNNTKKFVLSLGDYLLKYINNINKRYKQFQTIDEISNLRNELKQVSILCFATEGFVINRSKSKEKNDYKSVTHYDRNILTHRSLVPYPITIFASNFKSLQWFIDLLREIRLKSHLESLTIIDNNVTTENETRYKNLVEKLFVEEHLLDRISDNIEKSIAYIY